MEYLARYLEKAIKSDLKQKMVFLSGPRQSGKTTLAKKLLRDSGTGLVPAYLNWDAGEDREWIIKERFPTGTGMLVLDEVHKYSRWRQVVKGLYDKRNKQLQILVTGSGHLDYYRYGGDSLQGRYHFYRLHPLTLAEIPEKDQQGLLNLLKYGGFPEQYILQSERESRRWSREYRTRIIYDDLNSLENVKDMALLENLSLRLPDLVGSPLSVNPLRGDLQVSHQTVSRWLSILEHVYMIFRIYPFGAPMIRAVKKEAKHYHFDWTLVEEEGTRFENLVACHLLKWCHFRQDYHGEELELRFFRDVDRREVDFVLVKKGQPILFLECKVRNKNISQGLKYLKKRFAGTRAVQIGLQAGESYVNREGIEVCPAVEFLQNLI